MTLRVRPIAPVLMAAVLAAQPQKPSFDVASIKPNKMGSGPSSSRVATGTLTMDNVALKKCIAIAYGIRDDRDYAIAGPDWLRSENFNIQAKFPPETPPDQIRLMLQSLLTERFKLAVHRETRQLNQYSLVPAKGGFKLQKVENPQNRTSARAGRLEAQGIGMGKLADLLSRFLDRPVIDATGIAGEFNFQLEWRPEDTQRLMGPGDATDPVAGPSIFTAIEEQLGLKMEVKKGPLEILVVDHVEKLPTEN